MNGIKSKIVKRKGERIDGYINIHIEEAREKSSKSNFNCRNLLKAQLIPYHQLNIPQNPSSDKMNIDQRNNSSSLNNDKGTSRKRCPQMSSGKDREIKISYGCRIG